MLIRKAAHLVGLLVASIAVHFAHLAVAPLYPRVMPLNDVLLYGYWLQQMQINGGIFGVTQPWVYPYPALVPMVLAKLVGGSLGIVVGWIALATILNLIFILWVTEFGRAPTRRFIAAWFWIVFIALLGPVAVGRLDIIATSLAAFGLLFLLRDRISLAATFFTFGAWIKIWPFVLVIGQLVTTKSRQKIAIGVGAVVAAVAVAAVALQGNSNVLSFLFQQNARGIQIESPVATFWLWAAKLQIGDAGIYFDKEMLTNQVSGGPIFLVGTLVGLLMLASLAHIAFHAWRAAKRGAALQELFAVIALAATLTLIVCNKVGSPQFETWLIVPIIAMIIWNVAQTKVAAISSLAIALLTGLVYPILYIDLMSLGWLSIATLTARNVLLVLFWIWSLWRLQLLTKSPATRRSSAPA